MAHLSLVERKENSRVLLPASRCGWWRPVLGVPRRRSAGNCPVTVTGSVVGLITLIGQRYPEPDVPKPSKLAEHRGLGGVVEEKLEEWWSSAVDKPHASSISPASVSGVAGLKSDSTWSKGRHPY